MMPLIPPATNDNSREEEMLSKGFVLRTGGKIKDFGERMAHVKICGVRVFGWCCDAVIRLGHAMRDTVMDCPIRAMENGYFQKKRSKKRTLAETYR